MTIREKIEELARSTFDEMQKTEGAYKKAKAAKEALSLHTGPADAEYMAKAARAEADFQEAELAVINMKRKLPQMAEEKLAAIRREYAAELMTRFGIDPAKLDQASLELLKSGIMKPSEYRIMFDKAARDENVTMTRVIAKFAAEAYPDIAKKYGENDNRARELRMIGYKGNLDPAAEKLDAFDRVSDTFHRTLNNSAMIKHWDGLAGPMIDLL